VILSGVMPLPSHRLERSRRPDRTGAGENYLQKKLLYGLERLMDGATKVKTSEFGDHIINNMARTVAAD